MRSQHQIILLIAKLNPSLNANISSASLHFNLLSHSGFFIPGCLFILLKSIRIHEENTKENDNRVVSLLIFKNRTGVLYRDLKHEDIAECFRPDKPRTAPIKHVSTYEVTCVFITYKDTIQL